jgi:predicted ABC-type ATPase
MQLDELYNPLLTEKVAPKYAFKAVFVMGPPGSGKNTIIDNHLYNPHFKLVDVDETLARFKSLNKKDTNYSVSWEYSNKRKNLWQQNWLGLIINTTGRNSTNVIDLKKTLEEFGYDTFGIFVKVSYDTSMQRIKSRPSLATNPRDAGREVGLDYFDKAYISSIRNLPIYKSNFNAVNFATVINDNTSPYYEQSIANLDRSLTRFLRSPIQNPNGNEKLKSL